MTASNTIKCSVNSSHRLMTANSVTVAQCWERVPGYPNTDRVFLLPICCPLHSALKAANLVQPTTYLTNLMQIYIQTANMTVHIQYQQPICTICQLQQTVQSLSEDASKTLVEAFISCRLNYCNHLFLASRNFGRTGEQVTVASDFKVCLVTGTRRSDYITPVLRQLLGLDRYQNLPIPILQTFNDTDTEYRYRYQQ